MSTGKDFQEIAKARRSVNFFDPQKPLDGQVVKDIINLATLAPSCFNTQPWQIIAAKSKEKRQEIFEKSCKQPKVIEAPVVLMILGDKEGYKRSNPIWDEKIRLGNAQEDAIAGYIQYSDNVLFPTDDKKVGFAVSNAGLLAMSIMYAAQYYGVDSHPMIGFDEAKMREIFAIPDNQIVVMMICLGYFDQTKTLFPRETRRSYEQIVKEY